MDALNPYDYLAYSWASAASVGGNSYMEPLEKLYGIGRYTTTNPGGIESYRNVKTDNIQKRFMEILFLIIMTFLLRVVLKNQSTVWC